MCDSRQTMVLYVQALTFNKMAPMALGRIDIQYRRIACQVPENLNIIVDHNNGAGSWIRLQVKVCNHDCQCICFSHAAAYNSPLAQMAPASGYACRPSRHIT